MRRRQVRAPAGRARGRTRARTRRDETRRVPAAAVGERRRVARDARQARQLPVRPRHARRQPRRRRARGWEKGSGHRRRARRREGRLRRAAARAREHVQPQLSSQRGGVRQRRPRHAVLAETHRTRRRDHRVVR